MAIICKVCGRKITKKFKYSRKRWETFKYCGSLCSHADNKTKFKYGHVSLVDHKGDKNPMWRGGNAGYGALHSWLKSVWGKAKRCEGSNCKKISSRYSWALKKGREYSRNRKDYMMLCRSCHSRYDYKGNLQKTYSSGT